jgi:carbon storage regulator CsrA
MEIGNHADASAIWERKGAWMALVLTRKEGQSMLISNGIQEIKIKISKIESGRQVRIAIEAPKEMRISRISEVANGNAKQNP